MSERQHAAGVRREPGIRLLLARIIDALGTNAAARLLGTDRAPGFPVDYWN